jgi:hypothetical protein
MQHPSSSSNYRHDRDTAPSVPFHDHISSVYRRSFDTPRKDVSCGQEASHSLVGCSPNLRPYTWLHAYDALTNECGMLYPPREKIVWADFRIYDMQTFDRIAHAEETFRPRTCYPGAQDVCLLPNKCRSVFKRSHSCGCD